MRTAIIGAGLMGRWHANAAKQAGAQIVGVSDPDSGRGDALGARLRVPAFRDAATMLGETAPEVVHVCSPAPTHADIVAQALNTDTHVLCEKPLAADEDETRTLYALAEQRGRVLCPVHQYAFQRCVERFRRDADRAGAICHATFHFHTTGGGAAAQDYREIAADIVPHPFSILQTIFPDCAKWASDIRVRCAKHGEWEIACEYDGVRIRVIISLMARPPVATMTIAGDAATYEADLFHDYGVWLSGRSGRLNKAALPLMRATQHLMTAGGNLFARAVRAETAYPGLRALTAAFYASCSGRESPPVAAEQAIEIAAIRDAFIRASRSERQSPAVELVST